MTRAPKLDSVRIVDRAKKLIAEKGWTKGSFARHANGNDIDACGPNAACFCIEGALYRARRELRLNPKENPFAGGWSDDLDAALRAEAPGGVPHFNDAECKAPLDAIAFLDRVRKRLKGS